MVDFYNNAFTIRLIDTSILQLEDFVTGNSNNMVAAYFNIINSVIGKVCPMLEAIHGIHFLFILLQYVFIWVVFDKSVW